MARKRKFASAGELAAETEAYFNSISAEEEVTRLIYDGVCDNGKPKYKPAPVMGKHGKPLVKTIWYTPPTVGGLCLYLGISRKTLGEYAQRGGAYAEAVDNARSIISTYLEEKISDPDIKNVKGVQLALEALLRALEEDRNTATQRMTGAERAELVKELAACGFAELLNESETDTDGT